MTALSVEDRLDILDLYARYAHAFDSADSDGWAEVFTEDGELRTVTGVVSGREALRSLCADRNAESPGMSHHQTNVTFAAGADGRVVGGSYYLVLRPVEGVLAFRALGRYQDEIVKIDGRWLFASRQVFPWMSPQPPDQVFVFQP